MGSRGVIGFIVGGEIKAHHTFFSGDPCDLGEQAMRFVAAHDDAALRQIAESIVFEPEDKLVPSGRKAELIGMINKMCDDEARTSKLPKIVEMRRALAASMIEQTLNWEGFHDVINYKFAIYGYGFNIMNDASDILGRKTLEAVVLINITGRRIELYCSEDGDYKGVYGPARWQGKQKLIASIGFDEARAVEDFRGWWMDFTRARSLDG